MSPKRNIKRYTGLYFAYYCMCWFRHVYLQSHSVEQQFDPITRVNVKLPVNMRYITWSLGKINWKGLSPFPQHEFSQGLTISSALGTTRKWTQMILSSRVLSQTASMSILESRLINSWIATMSNSMAVKLDLFRTWVSRMFRAYVQTLHVVFLPYGLKQVFLTQPVRFRRAAMLLHAGLKNMRLAQKKITRSGDRDLCFT